MNNNTRGTTSIYLHLTIQTFQVQTNLCSVTGTPVVIYLLYSFQDTALEMNSVNLRHCLAPNGNSLKSLQMTYLFSVVAFILNIIHVICGYVNKKFVD